MILLCRAAGGTVVEAVLEGRLVVIALAVCARHARRVERLAVLDVRVVAAGGVARAEVARGRLASHGRDQRIPVLGLHLAERVEDEVKAGVRRAIVGPDSGVVRADVGSREVAYDMHMVSASSRFGISLLTREVPVQGFRIVGDQRRPAVLVLAVVLDISLGYVHRARVLRRMGGPLADAVRVFLPVRHLLGGRTGGGEREGCGHDVGVASGSGDSRGAWMRLGLRSRGRFSR